MYLTFFIVNTSRTHLEHYRYGATTCLTMYFKELDKKTHWWVPVVLGRCGFFALGNSHLISTIDIAGAYTGVSSFSIWVRRSLSKKKKSLEKKIRNTHSSSGTHLALDYFRDRSNFMSTHIISSNRSSWNKTCTWISCHCVYLMCTHSRRCASVHASSFVYLDSFCTSILLWNCISIDTCDHMYRCSCDILFLRWLLLTTFRFIL